MGTYKKKKQLTTALRQDLIRLDFTGRMYVFAHARYEHATLPLRSSGFLLFLLLSQEWRMLSSTRDMQTVGHIAAALVIIPANAVRTLAIDSLQSVNFIKLDDVSAQLYR